MAWDQVDERGGDGVVEGQGGWGVEGGPVGWFRAEGEVELVGGVKVGRGYGCCRQRFAIDEDVLNVGVTNV